MISRPWTAPALITWPSAVVIPFLTVGLLVTGFVVLGPSFLTPAGVPLQLPRAVTAEAVGPAGVVITMTDPSLIYVNGQLTTLDDLPQLLKPLLAAQAAVLIKADARVPMGQMAKVWDLCRQLGASRVAMATTQASP